MRALAFAIAVLPCFALAEAPELSIPPATEGVALGGDRPIAQQQSEMPSITIRRAFLAEKERRGPDGTHIPRDSTEFQQGTEVYFFVSLNHVSRQPAGEPGGAYAIALRGQYRDADGTPMMDWAPLHTYTGSMTMAPDDPEFFSNWVTGGVGANMPPGPALLALEFTDTLRPDGEAQAPAVVVFDLVVVE